MTRKIARAAARISAGLQEHLHLGNLDAVRDWGYAPEYVEGMWRMLQADQPGDYVLATGTAYTVRDFARFCFDHVNLDWRQHVRFDRSYLRPSEVDALVGDPGKAHDELGWTPRVTARSSPASWSTPSSPLRVRPAWSWRVSMLPRDARLYVAGRRGLAGSAVVRAAHAAGFTDVVGATSDELDLRDRAAVFEHLLDQRPTALVLAAARVGGILANSSRPADFISENLQIQVNVMDAAARAGVRRLLFLGSSCAYPKFAGQPIRESSLLQGSVEPTNEAYAVAKIAGLMQVRAVRNQLGLPWISAMPTNLYGPGTTSTRTTHTWSPG